MVEGNRKKKFGDKFDISIKNNRKWKAM